MAARKMRLIREVNRVGPLFSHLQCDRVSGPERALRRSHSGLSRKHSTIHVGDSRRSVALPIEPRVADEEGEPYFDGLDAGRL